MIKYILLLFFIVVLLPIPALTQIDCSSNRYIDDLFSVQTTNDVAVFATVDALAPLYTFEFFTFNKDLSFDFYEPVGDTLSKRPLIIMAFGGAFLAGSKEQAELVAYCEAMAAKGFCVASIDYRLGFNVLSTNSAVRAVYRGLQDFKAAVRYFRANAAMYDVDPKMIYGGGNSAGAINALHAAYADESDRSHPLLDATYNFPNLECMNCVGSYPMLDSEPDAVVNLWGGVGDTTWIEGITDDAPHVSFHGTGDNTVSAFLAPPFQYPIFPELYGSVPIHQRSLNQAIPTRLDTFSGQGHELWGTTANAQYIVDTSAYFLHELIRPEAPMVAGNSIACEGVAESYCISAPNPSSQYCWNVINGSILSSTATCVTVLWSAAGTGTIEAIEENCNDAKSEPTAFNITINPSPIANFSFTYVGSSIQFMDLSSGYNSLLWDFGDDNTSAAINPLHTYTVNGEYTVNLTVTNAQGCSHTYSLSVHQYCQANMTITLNPIPSDTYQVDDWIYSNTVLDLGSTVDFKAGNMIELEAGFEVNLGDVFHAQIEPCNN